MDPDANGAAPERTFTQAELDRIVGQRLAEERAKFADFDALKAKAAKFDEIDAASKTEVERLTQQLAAAQAQAQAATEQSRATLRRAALMSEAAKAQAVDPDVVLALLASDDTIAVTDDGSVQGAAEAVARLLEAKTYLRAAPVAPEVTPPAAPTPPTSGATPPPKGGADGGPKGRPAAGQLSREDLARMTPDQIVAAKAEGRLTSLLGA